MKIGPNEFKSITLSTPIKSAAIPILNPESPPQNEDTLREKKATNLPFLDKHMKKKNLLPKEKPVLRKKLMYKNPKKKLS